MNLSLFLRSGLYISKDTVIYGNISVDGNGHIAGVVNGNINAKGHLTIEKQGTINGDVFAKNILVKGKIKGNVQCDGKIYVSKKAEVHGNIHANEVVVDKEGLVKGRIAQLYETGNAETARKPEDEVIKIPAFVEDEKPVDETPQTWF